MDFVNVFMAHKIMFFILPNIMLLVSAAHFRTQEYDINRLAQVKCCTDVVMKIVHGLILFECAWSAYQMFKFRMLVTGHDLLEHLEIISSLMGCAD